MFIHNIDRGRFRGRYDVGFYSLYFYPDIVESGVVGDNVAPLLRIVLLAGNTETRCKEL